jgi:hypothetical protein
MRQYWASSKPWSTEIEDSAFCNLAGVKLQACPQFVLHDVGVKVRMTMEAVFTKGRFPQQRPAQQTVNPDLLPRAMVVP